MYILRLVLCCACRRSFSYRIQQAVDFKSTTSHCVAVVIIIVTPPSPPTPKPSYILHAMHEHTKVCDEAYYYLCYVYIRFAWGKWEAASIIDITSLYKNPGGPLRGYAIYGWEQWMKEVWEEDDDDDRIFSVLCHCVCVCVCMGVSWEYIYIFVYLQGKPIDEIIEWMNEWDVSFRA